MILEIFILLYKFSLYHLIFSLIPISLLITIILDLSKQNFNHFMLNNFLYLNYLFY